MAIFLEGHDIFHMPSEVRQSSRLSIMLITPNESLVPSMSHNMLGHYVSSLPFGAGGRFS